MNNKLFLSIKSSWLMAAALACASPLFADDPDDIISLASDLPQAQILATDPTALVGASTAAFTLIRNGPTNADLVVQYTISGSASNGVDYAKIAEAVTIPAGFLAADLAIQPIFDAARRGNKTVVLTLNTNAAYQLDSHSKATASLVDDVFNNLPPTVTLTIPTNGSVFTLPANVTLTAEASDTDGTVQKVSFYADDRFLGSATNSPYSLTWTNPPVGQHALFARAVDSLGKSTLSAPVHISVTNAAPVVAWVSPTNGQVFPVPANVKLEASVSDSDDAISRVQFISDGRVLATFTNSPYTLTWTNVSPGKHTVMAVARDVFGLRGSATVSFTVSNAPPVVSLTAPTDGANFKAKDNITLQANASDPDGTISQVTFWASGRYLGMAKASPYTITWQNAHAGLYQLTAIATDNRGLKTASAPITINVSK
jgi:hypothetical protein